MNMLEFNKRRYVELWRATNRELNTRESLGKALSALEEQQFDVGFIQDDLKSVIHFRLYHPENKLRIFTVQYNPKRADRYGGVGRKTPPPGAQAINNGCFLCKDNVRWQQRGIEVGYDIRTKRAAYIAWMNPFPLMPVHTTITARRHIPQTWLTDDEAESVNRFQWILQDLIELARRLPGFVGFYNGVDAGASIPDHFHFHFFKRFVGSGPFPLERAAQQTVQAQGGGDRGILVKDYPITTIYFRGNDEEIMAATASWIDRFARLHHYRAALTINVIATADRDEPDKVHLYVIPRSKFYSHAPGMVGMIGGLEVLGEIVFSSQIEKQMLDTGQVDFHFVERILAAVEPLGIISEAMQ